MVLNTNHLKVIDEDEISLTQGQSTAVDVGAQPDDHLLVAFGFASPTPDEDQTVSSKVHWDQSDGRQEVVFEVGSASADPTINYTVYVVD